MLGSDERGIESDVLSMRHVREAEGSRLPDPEAPRLSDAEAVPQGSVRNDQSTDEDECVACLDERAGVCLIPCGHVCLCAACAAALSEPRTCPMCRTPIEQIVQAVHRVGG